MAPRPPLALALLEALFEPLAPRENSVVGTSLDLTSLCPGVPDRTIRFSAPTPNQLGLDVDATHSELFQTPKSSRILR